MKIAATLAIVGIFLSLFVALSVPIAADDDDEEFSITALVTSTGWAGTPMGVFFDENGLLNIPGHSIWFNLTGDLEGILVGSTDTVIDLATGNGEAHATKNVGAILGATWVHPNGEVLRGFFECDVFDVEITGFVGFTEFKCEGISGNFDDDAELKGTIDFSTPIPGVSGTMEAQLELDD